MASSQRSRMLLLVLAPLLGSAFCSVPVVTHVQLSVQNQLRTVTLRYTASEKPVILWRTMSYLSHLENTTNTFSGTQGTATVIMDTNPRYDILDTELAAEIYADSYHVTLHFRKGNIRLSQSESNTIVPVKLSAAPNGTVSFDPNALVNIDVFLESDDLSSYTAEHDYGQLESFEYVSYPPTVVGRRRVHERVISWQRDYYNAFIMPYLNITESSNTEAHTTASINTTFPYMAGEYEFAVRLALSSATSLIENIVLRHYVYLKERSQESPFRRNVNFVSDHRNRKRVDTLIDRALYTQADAMGFPKPDLKLFRGCTEVLEPEIKIYKIGTPYRTRKIFLFTNASDTLTGEYYFRAFSGNIEIAKMNYIQKI